MERNDPGARATAATDVITQLHSGRDLDLLKGLSWRTKDITNKSSESHLCEIYAIS